MGESVDASDRHAHSEAAATTRYRHDEYKEMTQYTQTHILNHAYNCQLLLIDKTSTAANILIKLITTNHGICKYELIPSRVIESGNRFHLFFMMLQSQLNVIAPRHDNTRDTLIDLHNSFVCGIT